MIKLTLVRFWDVPDIGRVELLVGDGCANDKLGSNIKHIAIAACLARMAISLHVRRGRCKFTFAIPDGPAHTALAALDVELGLLSVVQSEVPSAVRVL
jgi:hypothetical protein